VSGLLEFNGVKASMCVASGSHTPTPIRYIWHHLQPETAGGATDTVNLVELCDSCHYSIHVLLYIMAQIALGNSVSPAAAELIVHPPRREQLALASQGYQLCLDAGTVAQIPNEGGIPL
jgi:HNH endonuclease